MNIVVLRRKKGCSRLVTLGHTKLVLAGTGLAIFLLIATTYIGFHVGVAYKTSHPDELALAYQNEIEQLRIQVAEVERNAEENLNALTYRLGKLQAHVIRLDALGDRITNMAKLDKGEFDFQNPPAIGGPHVVGDASEVTVPDFITELVELESKIDDRSKQLNILETMLMSRNLQAEVVPAGRPVKRGWLSSYFGMRTDPFDGRRVHHSGVDFAGKEDSDIITVASGVVTYSGRRSGYGNLVEINHGNGYVTRYGHNKENRVKVGQKVDKGTVIAIMGSTGRSTGPHVHFEVIINGRAVNPKKYIHASNKSLFK